MTSAEKSVLIDHQSTGVVQSDSTPGIAATLEYCWQEACKFQYLAKKSSKPLGHISASRSRDEVRGLAEELSRQYDQSARSHPLGRFLRSLKTVLQYSSVLDLLCQQKTEVAAIWGCVHFLIIVATRVSDISELAGEGVLQALRFIDWGERTLVSVLKLDPRPSRYPDVEKEVINVFKHTLVFLQDAWIQLGKGKIRELQYSFHSDRARYLLAPGQRLTTFDCTWAERLKQVFTSDFQTKFKSKIRDLEVAGQGLKQIMYLQLQECQNEGRNAVVSRLDSILYHISPLTAVLGEVSQALSSAPPHRPVEDRRRAVLRRLTSCLEGDHIASPSPGTGSWIKHEPTYRHWASFQNSGNLWLLGDTGSGKSVLMKQLHGLPVEGQKFAYFFSRMGDVEDNSVESFAYGLLSALSLLGDNCLSRPLPTSPATLAPGAGEIDRVWNLVESYLQTNIRLTLMIDALDECSSDDTAIADFMSRLDDLQNKYAIRVLISCRPQPKFLSCAKNSPRIRVEGAKCNTDVAKFMKESLIPSHSSALRETMLGDLSLRANGNFQIARMLLSSVHQARTTNRAFACIQAIPDELSKLYQLAVDDFDRARPQQDRIDRNAIFALIAGARQALTIIQISVACALKTSSRNYDIRDSFDDPEGTIRDVGYPFVTLDAGTVGFTHVTVKEFFMDHVESSPDQVGALRLSDEESNKLLVRKCLACLLLGRYRSPTRIGGLLHRNFHDMSKRPSATTELQQEQDSELDGFYEYAARNWISHLTAIVTPDDGILQLASDFINCGCFVHWCEYIIRHNNELGVAVEAKSKLARWNEGLPEGFKGQLDMAQYFVKPYTMLHEQFRDQHSDKELPWLTLYRLGVYYSLSDFAKSENTLGRVVEGLAELLGDANPLTLRAKVDWARLLLAEGQMELARDTFKYAWEVQRELLPDSADPFVSLQLAALTTYYMLDFEVSKQMQEEACEGLCRVLGLGSYDTLASKLFLGYAQVALGNDEIALQNFTEIYDMRSAAYGDEDGLALTSLVGLGQSQTILGRPQAAVKSLKQAWETRSRLYGSHFQFTVDSAIHLVVAYRGGGMRDEARYVLDGFDVDQIRRTQYPQYCQIMHLRALLLYDDGKIVDAVRLLQTILLESHENNRWLGWLRLSLAAILTEQGEEDEALMLFDNIIREQKAGTDPHDLCAEPDSPRILRLAEDVINLLRRRRGEEAEELLKAEGCGWVRKKDFWIPVGGPVAETGLTRGPWPE